MIDVYIALGSNLDPKTHLKQGILLLKELLTEVRVSKCYQSQALNGGDDYWNMILYGKTNLSFYGDLITRLKDFEKKCGRTKNKFHQCALDLDLLLFGDMVIDGVLPHSDLYNYLHVLVPFCDLASDNIDLIQHCLYKDLLAKLQNKEKERLTLVDLDI